MSILHGISKIWSIARNISVFRDIPTPISTTPNQTLLSLDISVPNPVLDSSSPVPIAMVIEPSTDDEDELGSSVNANQTLSTTPRVCTTVKELQNFASIQINMITPVNPHYQPLDGPRPHGHGNNGEEVMYYTGRAKPEVSPVITPRHKNKRSLLYHLTPTHSAKSLNPSPVGSASRTRRHSECSPNPYNVPPPDLMRKRLKPRLSNLCDGETPLSRRRAYSEPSEVKLEQYQGEKLQEATPRLSHFKEEPQDGPPHVVSCAQNLDEQPSTAKHDIASLAAST